MIRLAWRQFRVQSLVGAGALVCVAAVLAATWPHVSRLAEMVPRPALGGFYGVVSATLDMLVVIVPGLIGVFWGAPLVSRELETHSILLAWTQSVTRRRWLAVRLGLVGLCGVATSGLFALMGNIWSGPVDQIHMDRFAPLVFGARGVVPLGYAAFSFALGVTLGVVMRRTQPAMAATLAAFAGIRAAVTYLVRPYFGAPTSETFALDSSDVALGLFPSEQTVKAYVEMPNALVRSVQIVDGSGQTLTPQAVTNAFPDMGAGQPAGLGWFQDGVDKLASAYHVVVSYQPADRFWTFQAMETALFAGLALVLLALCFWTVERRLP